MAVYVFVIGKIVWLFLVLEIPVYFFIGSSYERTPAQWMFSNKTKKVEFVTFYLLFTSNFPSVLSCYSVLFHLRVDIGKEYPPLPYISNKYFLLIPSTDP